MRPVEELCRARPRAVSVVYVAEGHKSRELDQVIAVARDRAITVEVRPRAVVADLAGAGAHQGVVALTGAYRYAVEGGSERGMVAVETYSDEWRPTAPVLQSQPVAPAGRFATVGMRDHWWLFVLAIAAFTAEWAWRRRLGLP